MKRKLAASPVNLYVTAAAAAVVGTLSVPAPASAVTIIDLFVFGDSYSDTGAFFPLTNGSTAVGYLAKNFNITLTTSKNPDPYSVVGRPVVGLHFALSLIARECAPRCDHNPLQVPTAFSSPRRSSHDLLTLASLV